MRPRIGLIGGTAETTILVTDAVRALDTELAPTSSDARPCDLWLIDATAGIELCAEENPRYGTTPRFLVVPPALLDLTTLNLKGSGHGIVRTSALAADLDHALRLTAALAEVPVRPAKLPPWLVRAEFYHRLPNDPTMAYQWMAELHREAIERVQCPEDTALRLASAAFEAVTNAMLRGNLEISSALSNAGDAAMVSRLIATRRRQSPFRERSVWASSRFSTSEIRVVIRDEGPGFPSMTDTPARLLGRGGFVLRAFCDEVRYNDDGNEVTLLAFPSGLCEESSYEQT